jgi:hypothetical protein
LPIFAFQKKRVSAALSRKQAFCIRWQRTLPIFVKAGAKVRNKMKNEE